MKPIVLALILGGLFGALAACVPVAGMNKTMPAGVERMKTDLEMILTTVFRDYLRDKTAEGEIKVLFVKHCEIDADRRCKEVASSRVYFEQFDGKPYRIKTGRSGYRYRPEGEFGVRICRDKETGQRCDLIGLLVQSIEGEVAHVSLMWGATSMSSSGTGYHLRKVNGEWQIEKKIRVIGGA